MTMGVPLSKDIITRGAKMIAAGLSVREVALELGVSRISVATHCRQSTSPKTLNPRDAAIRNDRSNGVPLRELEVKYRLSSKRIQSICKGVNGIAPPRVPIHAETREEIRAQWSAGTQAKAIAENVGVSINTVKRYVADMPRSPRAPAAARDERNNKIIAAAKSGHSGARIARALGLHHDTVRKVLALAKIDEDEPMRLAVADDLMTFEEAMEAYGYRRTQCRSVPASSVPVRLSGSPSSSMTGSSMAMCVADAGRGR